MRIKPFTYPQSKDLGCNSTHNQTQVLFSVSEAKQNLAHIMNRSRQLSGNNNKMIQTAEEQYSSQPLHSRTCYK